MDNNHLYQLDRTSKKFICPDCGRRTYVLYVNTLTGRYLHPTVGKCDRLDNCNRHYPPREFFRDNPGYADDPNSWTRLDARPVEAEQRQVSYVPDKFLARPTSEESRAKDNLYTFLAGRFGAERVERVYSLYRVTASRRWTLDGGYATVFPQIDTLGRIHQLKVMAYNPLTGHRLRGGETAKRWSDYHNCYVDDASDCKVWFAGKSVLGDPDANLRQTLFGAHLLKAGGYKAANIVESEKTALIAALRYGDRYGLWLATGGKNGCRWNTYDVFGQLKGLDVWLYPDLGCAREWAEKSEAMAGYGITRRVSTLFEDGATEEELRKGYDIGDYILDQAQRGDKA